jgi:anthranilate synthase component 1
MLVKDGVAYLQAGVSLSDSLLFGGKFDKVLTIGQGGIVFDSDPYDEWIETINKLGALVSPKISHYRQRKRRLTAPCN